jgi:cardiolipin synthase (CMP-forming)
MARGPLYSAVQHCCRPRAGGFLFPKAGVALSIPNLITLGRILLVPVVVWAIMSNAMWVAFMLFLLAGVSDAVDGFLAKRFNMTTVLGAYLDPLADKALIVSIYLTLGINGYIPRWLVILVVSRDILIVGGIMLSWLMGDPLKIKPLLVSKLNTVAQIAFACVVLGSLGFNFEVPLFKLVLMGLVAVLTLLSIAAYLAEWVRHVNSTTAQP